MCDRSPGVRCSDYATSTLKITKKRLEKVQSEKATYEEKYAESLANTEKPTPRDVIRQNKYQRLVESEKAHQRIVDGAEFEYHSCPVGQAELEEDLKKAVEVGDVPLQEELEARIQAGKDYRADARETARILDETEKEQGPEAAQEQNWQFYEEAVETETEATIQMGKSQVELDAARAEYEEYQRAMEEYRKTNRIDTPEEERAKALKKKVILLTIGTLAAAVITYSLIAQSAGGKKSQLLQTGKSMLMRQVMTGGRQHLTRLLTSDSKEADAREKRAEQEAEERAAEARERIYQKHEKDLRDEERKKLRDEERQAELLHRNALRAEEREAERERRREELAHYDDLLKTFKDVNLTPEMQAHINSKKPQGYRPNNGAGNGQKAGGRQYSSRRQGKPDVAGKAARESNSNVAGDATGNPSQGANTVQPEAATTATSTATSTVTAATTAMPKVEVTPTEGKSKLQQRMDQLQDQH